MRCGKHIMPETSVERFPSSGAARYPPFRATEPQLLRGTHAVTFLPLVFDIATIWLRLRRAGFFVALRAFVKKGDCVNQDRKSTRLNSSHGYISYAVFCLKKKKKINTIKTSDTYE